MIGSAIGAGLKIGASIYGGIKASQAMKQVRDNINNQMRENQDWYDRRYNEDATQRADAQAALKRTEESIRNRNNQAAATQAVMGGTDESVAAARAANNDAIATTTSNIAVAGEQRKAAIESQYQSTKANLNSQLNELTKQKAQNTIDAVNGVAEAGASIAGALDPTTSVTEMAKKG